MRIARVMFEGEGRVGWVDGDSVRLLDSTRTLPGLFASTEAELDQQLHSSTAEIPLEAASLLTPLPSPSKIVCVGLNYRDHAGESGQVPPERPLLFSKPSSAIVGPGDGVSWPTGLTQQVDWEAELGVVVGSTLRGQDSDGCLKGVFGYTAANDITARDLQFGDGQWFRGKSLDTFCPVGPYIVTADQFGDPQRKSVRALVNGVCMQDGSTQDMIFPVGFLLSWISSQITLYPGDLVLTGTPPGVGAFRTPPVFLKPGDVVEVEVEGIGVLRNPVVAG